MASRFKSRKHAVEALCNSYGTALRKMADNGVPLTALYECLRHEIDLATLPPTLADKYEESDRAWHQFLNDILRAAKVSV